MNVIPSAIVHSMKETLMPNVTYNENAILKAKYQTMMVAKKEISKNTF